MTENNPDDISSDGPDSASLGHALDDPQRDSSDLSAALEDATFETLGVFDAELARSPLTQRIHTPQDPIQPSPAAVPVPRTAGTSPTPALSPALEHAAAAAQAFSAGDFSLALTHASMALESGGSWQEVAPISIRVALPSLGASVVFTGSRRCCEVLVSLLGDTPYRGDDQAQRILALHQSLATGKQPPQDSNAPGSGGYLDAVELALLALLCERDGQRSAARRYATSCLVASPDLPTAVTARLLAIASM